MNATKPVVGMPATLCYVNDRIAGTVTSVSPSGKTITFADENGARETKAMLKPDGQYHTAGYRPTGRRNTLVVSLGTARNYRAPEV